MLRNIIRYFCGLALILIGGSGLVCCSDDNNGLELPKEDMPESGYITLSLKCVEGTRAPEDYTEPGLNQLNENLIETVTICLWANGGDKPDDTATPDYVQTFKDVSKNNAATFRIPLTLALKHRLFETAGATCHAFAAVNVDIPDGDFTIADLRDMTIDSDFPIRKQQESFTMDGDCTVTYEPISNAAHGQIDLQRSASKITLALDVDNMVEQNAIVDGALVTSKWKPDTSAMRVWLKGGLAESTLDPNLEVNPAKDRFFDTSDDLTYTFTGNTAGEGNTPDNGNNPPVNGETTRTYPFIQDIPFYTYPHRWTAEPDDYAATYMILSIPWMQVDDEGNQIAGSTWRTCYYQVPVIAEDSDPLQLVRNVSYHVYLHVGLLGSFEPDVPLELDELEYSAAEWGNVDIDVTIPDVRYLVVDQNDYTVNNETSIAIPFYTSHETIVTDATMTFYRYNYDDVGRELPVVVTMAKNEESAKANRAGAPVFTAYFNNETNELEVSHDLVMYEGLTSGNNLVSFTQNDNKDMGKRNPKTVTDWNNLMNSISYFRKVSPTGNLTDVNEYSRVEFKITLQHKDINATQSGSHNFEEVINITQYPGMYITTVMNYCPTTSTIFEYTGAQGNTFINGCYTGLPESLSGYLCGDDPSLTTRTTVYQGIYSTQYYGWCTSIGLDSDNLNFNPNMYLVTVTKLSQEQGNIYKIGDPRSSYINNYLEDGTASGSNNPLPTSEDTRVWTNNITTTYTYTRYGTNLTATARGFVNAAAIEGGTRRLQYYYPTLETSANKMMIAPKFRICSSYAGTSWILNRELSRRRAAAYQEMGYPAGRWRLPTYGEVAFIMDLAAQYKIPRLFGTATTTWYYWCANGLVTVPAKNTGNGPSIPDNASGYIAPTGVAAPAAQRARFVYDEWYWGDADLQANGTIGSINPVYTFTWGDKPYRKE